MGQSKQSKQEAAIARQTKYNALGINEKIKLVQSRGGSVKELARLMAKKEESNKGEKK